MAISQLELCNKPVIAAVSGIAYGLGVDLCCACDIRYATTNVKFCIKVETTQSLLQHLLTWLIYRTFPCTQEVDIGLAADIGTLSRLPKIIGNDSAARELAYTARPFSAEEALKLGFISRIFASHKEVVGKLKNRKYNEDFLLIFAPRIPDAALATARIIAGQCPILFDECTHQQVSAAKSPIAVLGTKHLLNYSRDHTTAEGLHYTAIWNSAMLQSKVGPSV